jgi:hypothetical protein
VSFGIPGWQAALLRFGRPALMALAAAVLVVAYSAFRGLRLWFPAILAICFASVALHVWMRWRRERFIREAPLPQFLKRKLRETYPHLTQKDAALVERGLRQFFLACLRSERRFVSMPSRVVDSMWHEFILHTQAYRDWCTLAMGRFLHHTPSEVLGANATHNDGLRRAWYWACRDETIQPRQPTRLPLLFALDTKLAIANGFHYVPDCGGLPGARDADGHPVHCATSFGDGSSSGDGDGFGGEASSGDGDDGDDGGDGGCGGGGD